jgi:hypothetical protein
MYSRYTKALTTLAITSAIAVPAIAQARGGSDDPPNHEQRMHQVHRHGRHDRLDNDRGERRHDRADNDRGERRHDRADNDRRERRHDRADNDRRERRHDRGDDRRGDARGSDDGPNHG